MESFDEILRKKTLKELIDKVFQASQKINSAKADWVVYSYNPNLIYSCDTKNNEIIQKKK